MSARARSATAVKRMLLACAFGLACQSALAQSALCDAAARDAAEATGVPLAVLRTITRTETGRAAHGGVEPWPWTLNIDGVGTWHETPDAALRRAEAAIAAGARNLDIGCFQISHRWHGAEFTDLRAMLDPAGNALYAARFLSRLHRELGDWTEAAGAFHSRTPQLARRYRARYRSMQAMLPESAAAPAPDPTPAIAGRRQPPRRPAALAVAARPELFGASCAARLHGGAALPLTGRSARPLWERP